MSLHDQWTLSLWAYGDISYEENVPEQNSSPHDRKAKQNKMARALQLPRKTHPRCRNSLSGGSTSHSTRTEDGLAFEGHTQRLYGFSNPKLGKYMMWGKLSVFFFFCMKCHMLCVNYSSVRELVLALCCMLSYLDLFCTGSLGVTTPKNVPSAPFPLSVWKSHHVSAFHWEGTILKVTSYLNCLLFSSLQNKKVPLSIHCVTTYVKL